LDLSASNLVVEYDTVDVFDKACCDLLWIVVNVAIGRAMAVACIRRRNEDLAAKMEDEDIIVIAIVVGL